MSFWADVSSESIYPLLPLFVTVVLGGAPWALGLIEGVSDAIAQLSKAWSGAASDRVGKRRPFVVLGYFMSSLGKPLIGLAGSWPLVLVARNLDRLGKGIRGTARDALLADMVDKKDLGRAFGLHRMLDNAGAFVGSILAIVAVFIFKDDLRKAFLWAFIPGLIAMGLTLSVRDRQVAPKEPKPKGEKLRVGGDYWGLVGVMCLISLANTSDTFLLLRTTQMIDQSGTAKTFSSTFGLNLTLAGLVATILCYILASLSSTVFAYPAGLLADRWGRTKVLFVALAVFIACYAGFGFLAGGFFVLWAVYGCFNALFDGTQKALVAQLAPPDQKGAALGVFGTLSGIAVIVGNLMTGLLYSSFGPAVAFGTSAAIVLVAGLAYVPMSRRKWAPSN